MHDSVSTKGKPKSDTDIAVDEHFAHIWDVYEQAMLGRGILEERVRQLAVIGQCTTLGEDEEAEAEIRKALASGVATPAEILEVILQVRVYVGRPRVKRALRRFFTVLSDLGIERSEAVSDVGPEGWDSGRDLERERPHWLPSEEEFPARDRLIGKYGWKGMSIGMMMQPANFPSVISKCDELDEHFAKIWIDVVHEGMYARPVLSQRDRTLIMIADTISIMEMTQATFHMTNALRLGIPPREIMEICFHSTIYAGMPKLYSAFVLKDLLVKHGIKLDGSRG